jgi:hypothetical protein
MPDRFAQARHGRQAGPAAAPGRDAFDTPLTVRTAGIVLAGVVLTACSSSSETSFSLFADPGKYLYHTCAQIAAEQKNWTQRQQDLKALIDKADRSPGGAAVGFVAYKADYVAAGEELEVLQSTARSKKCEQEETWRSNSVIR